MAPAYTFFEDSLSKPKCVSVQPYKCGCTKRISEEIVYNDLTQNYKPRGNLDKASRIKYYQMLDNFMINCGKIPSIIHHEGAKDYENLMHLVDFKKSFDESNEGDFIIVHLIYQGAKWNNAGQNVIPQYFDAYFQVNPKDMRQIYEALEIARTAVELLEDQKPRTSAGDGNFVCPLCESRKTRKATLEYHLNLHLQIARFRCQRIDVDGEMCTKRCNQPTHFKTHLDNEHAGLAILENEKIATSITYEKVIRLAIGRLNIHNAIIEIDHIDYPEKKRDYEIDTQVMTELRKIVVEQNCQSRYCHFFPKDSNQTKETVIAVDVANSNALPSPQISTDHNFWPTRNGFVINNQDWLLCLNFYDNPKCCDNPKCDGVSQRKLMEQTETSPLQTSFVNTVTKKQGVKRKKKVTYSMNKKVQMSSDKENTSPNVPTDFHSKASRKHSLVHEERNLTIWQIS